jgi:hypothetical protein
MIVKLTDGLTNNVSLSTGRQLLIKKKRAPLGPHKERR